MNIEAKQIPAAAENPAVGMTTGQGGNARTPNNEVPH